MLGKLCILRWAEELSSEGIAQVPLKAEQQASSADNWQSK